MNWLTHHVNQIWHDWFNHEPTGKHEGSLYEFKNMLHELARLPQWFKMLRENSLPKAHQQCSIAPPVTLPENKLTCCLGVNVLECPILKSLEEHFTKRRQHKFYSVITDDEMDHVKAATCCWHIFKDVEIDKSRFDTSEGYIIDEGTRRYWDNVYENLSKGPPDREEEP